MTVGVRHDARPGTDRYPAAGKPRRTDPCTRRDVEQWTAVDLDAVEIDRGGNDDDNEVFTERAAGRIQRDAI